VGRNHFTRPFLELSSFLSAIPRAVGDPRRWAMVNKGSELAVPMYDIAKQNRAHDGTETNCRNYWFNSEDL
jgi:hypothetical protein